MNDADKLAGYVLRYWNRKRREQWPTVRQAARALGWRHEDVETAVGDYSPLCLMLTGYNVDGIPRGDLWVELLHPEAAKNPDPCHAESTA